MVIKGKVVNGEGIASSLNYPTANLDVDVTSLKFKPGVYAAKVILEGKEYKSAVIIKPDKVEAHLLEYVGDNFYNFELKVNLLGKVSEVEGLEGGDLQAKIEDDIKKVKKTLGL